MESVREHGGCKEWCEEGRDLGGGRDWMGKGPYPCEEGRVLSSHEGFKGK